MLAAFLTSFTTFFATIGPIEAAVLFASLSHHADTLERRQIALRATLIATAILLVAMLAGGPLLRQLGVTVAALQTAGGVILGMIALEMVFARPQSAFKLSPPEGAEAQLREDVAVFPLATPMLAGPGAMSAGILLVASAEGHAAELAGTFGALAVVMAISLMLLLVAPSLSKMLGITAQRVMMRVFGILLAAIAVQAIFDGILGSGLLKPV